MKALLLVALMGLAPALLASRAAEAPAATSSSKPADSSKSAAQSAAQSAESWAQKNLAGWPAKTIALAVELLKKYGQPAEATPTQVTWFHNGPWKRTVLFKEGVTHNFPKPHQDVLEQTIDYRVPVEKVAELLKYNGSLVIDRTRGELSAHCDSEKQNLIALNIANDIVTGDRNVEQALAYHAQIIVGLRDGEPESYPQKLRFKPVESADAAEEAPLLVHLGD